MTWMSPPGLDVSAWPGCLRLARMPLRAGAAVSLVTRTR